ncbi:DUF6965 family protein [Dyadobacter sp. CY345]|uniref:DUF6965 family protein n=1 Tax=Dyadobacter sp. CY345 TaxID=2909335 RepID=UPI0038D3AA32
MNDHDLELQELLHYFKTAKFPETPFKLNRYITIVSDPDKFINSKVAEIRRYKGSVVVLDSLFKHLRELKILTLNLT